jgi:phosphoribosylformimino-5-aminoimidazole carboxamide ribotide isomerase
LHQGQVKQIVGASLQDNEEGLLTNFESDKPSQWYAELYRANQARGGHVIKLGPGNDEAALSALRAWPKALQIGGGIHVGNALEWLDAGASHVIVTSWLFVNNQFSFERLVELSQKVGRERLVLDLSCRKVDQGWAIATNRWQTITDTLLSEGLIQTLEAYCNEFLIHAADVEGLQAGIDDELVTALSSWVKIPTTYAGGAQSIDDLKKVQELSQGNIDLTIGSALDIFGGQGCSFEDCIDWNQR